MNTVAGPQLIVYRSLYTTLNQSERMAMLNVIKTAPGRSCSARAAMPSISAASKQVEFAKTTSPSAQLCAGSSTSACTNETDLGMFRALATVWSNLRQ
jgi:hypothetical protein